MSTAIRVLILEDNSADAELMAAELRRVGFNFEWVRVQTEADYLARLDLSFDLILADYNLPQFDGLRALRLLQERNLDIPFIIVSGSIGEELAVSAMKEGATDYLLKDRLARLGQAVAHALEQKKLREEQRQAEKQLQIQTTALEAAANGIIITDRNGTITWVNPAFTKLTDYSPEEAIGQNPRLLKSGTQNQPFYENLWNTILSGQVWSGEIVNRRKDGALYTEEQTVTPVRNNQGEVTHSIAIKQDITERKRAEEEIQLIWNASGRCRRLMLR